VHAHPQSFDLSKIRAQTYVSTSFNKLHLLVIECIKESDKKSDSEERMYVINVVF